MKSLNFNLNNLFIIVFALTFIGGSNYGKAQSINCNWTTQDFPFRTKDDKFSWSKHIYYSVDYGVAQTLNKISFKVNSYNGNLYANETATYSDVKIYIRYTNLIDYTASNQAYPGISGFTLVYSGPVKFTCCNNDMITLNFGGSDAVSSFAYNGTQNLEILFENRNKPDGEVDANVIRTDYAPGGHFFGVYGSSNSSWSSAISQASLMPYGPAIVFNSASTDCIIPLPITLTSFTASSISKGAKVEWVTATEKDNDYFTLSRSWDGVHWENIARIHGAGNTTEEQKYLYQDEDFPQSEIVYYRLRQTDFDGQFEEFGPISVHHTEGKLSIYPNPAKNQLKIQTKSSYKVVDVTGQEVHLPALDENTLDVSGLKAGVYLILLENGEIGKFVKE